MSRKTTDAAAETQKKEPKPKKEKKPKAPKKNVDFNPVASAMFEIQRREATGNVISGGACILLGIIAIIVSIAKYSSNMNAITVDADKMFAYAWIAIAIAGLFIIIIGVYEILKSFISMEQINEWSKNAESHASPFHTIHEKRQAAQMNQSQSTEPAPTKGMAEDGSQAKKRFAFLGKKPEPKPDSGKIYDKYNPQENQQGVQKEKKRIAPPPKAKPLMEQKFDYGIHEEKKQTFADKFLAENKEDPFEKYRQELGVEETPKEEYVRKPQFKRSAAAEELDAAKAAAEKPADGFAVGSLFEQLASSQGISTDNNDDEGFFLGTNYSNAPSPADQQQLQKQVAQLQKQVEQVEQLQKQAEKVEQLQKQVEQVSQLQQQAEKVDQMQHQVEQLQQQVEKVQAAQPLLEKTPQMQPPMRATTPMPTIKPPPVPKDSPSQTIKPPPIPKETASNTIKPPPIPKETTANTIKPPPIPKQPQQMPPQMNPQQMSPQAMPQFYPQGGYVQPFGYQQMQPVQNMYQPLPNLGGMQGMMPNQGYQNGYMASPFGFAGAFVDSSEASYNPAMPPYTMHPFRPAQQVATPQMAQPAEQAYNSAMPPYTVHPFRAAQQVAAPQMAQPAEQAYNPAMPPYTVHPFRAAQQGANGQQEKAYNPAMPPYTVHPFKAKAADIASPQMAQSEAPTESYNSAMPPYTVHPFKAKSADIASPQIAQSEASAESYNSAMPPYTVRVFKSEDPAHQPITPQLYDPTKDGGANYGFTSPEDLLPKAVAPPEPAKQPEPVKQPEPAKQPKRTQRGGFMGVITQRSESANKVKKPPITQRLGEYKFSLFEELSGSSGEQPHKAAAPKDKKNEAKQKPKKETATTGGTEMAFNFNGGNQAPERKKSFSEKFLNRNGKKAVESSNEKPRGSSEIVQNGTPAQRKFVDASEYDEWVCPGCGSTNQEYVGVCSCGERKPRTKW